MDSWSALDGKQAFRDQTGMVPMPEEVGRLLDKQLFVVPFLFVNDHERSGSRGFC